MITSKAASRLTLKAWHCARKRIVSRGRADAQKNLRNRETEEQYVLMFLRSLVLKSIKWQE